MVNKFNLIYNIYMCWACEGVDGFPCCKGSLKNFGGEGFPSFYYSKFDWLPYKAQWELRINKDPFVGPSTRHKLE